MATLEVGSLKVAELKDELSKRGLDTKGLKKDLAARLKAFLDAEHAEKTQTTAIDAQEGGSEEDVTVEASEVMAVDAQDAPGIGLQVDDSPTESQPQAAAAEVSDADAPVEADPAVQYPPSAPREKDRPATTSVTVPHDASASSPSQSDLPSTLRSTSDHPTTPLPRDADVDMNDEGENPTDSVSLNSTASATAPLSLPPSLSHLSHPVTSVIYVSNLRRPFMLADLHDLLECTQLPIPNSRPPFANSDCPGVWLSGVKDHAYAGYDSAAAALAAATRINNIVWPDGVTGAALEVQFVDPSVVTDLVRQEENAWASGRTRLSLSVNRDGDGKFHFDLSKVGAGGPMRGRPGFGLATRLTGVAPPRGPAAERAAASSPYARHAPSGNANGISSQRHHAPSGRGMLRYTNTRPTLAWREGPGSTTSRG